MTRKRLSAPMGWSNTAEMTACVVDAVNRLTRLTYNVNSAERGQIHDPVPLMPRPYEVAVTVKVETVMLSDFNALLAEGNST